MAFSQHHGVVDGNLPAPVTMAAAVAAVHVAQPDADGVRVSGVYRVVTPDECIALAAELGDTGTLPLHPLMGGIPPHLPWESLELFETKVLPALRPAPVAPPDLPI